MREVGAGDGRVDEHLRLLDGLLASRDHLRPRLVSLLAARSSRVERGPQLRQGVGEAMAKAEEMVAHARAETARVTGELERARESLKAAEQSRAAELESHTRELGALRSAQQQAEAELEQARSESRAVIMKVERMMMIPQT